MMGILQASDFVPPSPPRLAEAFGILRSGLTRVFSRLRQRERAQVQDRLRLVSRLSLAPGGTVSLVAWDQERFLIATGSKGHIAVLALNANLPRKRKPPQGPQTARVPLRVSLRTRNSSSEIRAVGP